MTWTPAVAVVVAEDVAAVVSRVAVQLPAAASIAALLHRPDRPHLETTQGSLPLETCRLRPPDVLLPRRLCPPAVHRERSATARGRPSTRWSWRTGWPRRAWGTGWSWRPGGPGGIGGPGGPGSPGYRPPVVVVPPPIYGGYYGGYGYYDDDWMMGMAIVPPWSSERPPSPQMTTMKRQRPPPPPPRLLPCPAIPPSLHSRA